jgi:hypothetical protein
MARAFILSHGERVPGRGDTFVPEGKSISFYSEYDENTLRSIGLAAVNAGDIQPAETFESGEDVPNYRLLQFEDSAIAEHLAMESSATGGKLYFVGTDLVPATVSLCTTPTACAGTRPQHAPGCRGVFSQIAEDEILSVSCRGVEGEDGDNTRTMEGSTDFYDEYSAEAFRIVEWGKTDPDAAMEYYQSLTEATKAILKSKLPLAKFVDDYFAKGGSAAPAAVTEARNFVESHGDIAFVDYAEQFDAQQRSMVLAEQDLLEACWPGYGRRLLRNEGAPAFWEFFRGLDQEWMTLLSADDELYDAVAAGSQGADVAETSDWVATDADYDEARQTNEPFVKNLDEEVEAVWEIGGAVVLLGQPSSQLGSRVRQQPDYTSGTFQVERATFGAGSLRFSGVPPVFQDTVTWAIGQFSKKDVEFE